MKISNTALLFLKKEKKSISNLCLLKTFFKNQNISFSSLLLFISTYGQNRKTNKHSNKQTNPASQSISDTVEKIKCQRSQG